MLEWLLTVGVEVRPDWVESVVMRKMRRMRMAVVMMILNSHFHAGCCGTRSGWLWWWWCEGGCDGGVMRMDGGFMKMDE